MKIPLRLWKAKFSLKTNLGRLGAWNCHGITMFFLFLDHAEAWIQGTSRMG